MQNPPLAALALLWSFLIHFVLKIDANPPLAALAPPAVVSYSIQSAPLAALAPPVAVP